MRTYQAICCRFCFCFLDLYLCDVLSIHHIIILSHSGIIFENLRRHYYNKVYDKWTGPLLKSNTAFITLSYHISKCINTFWEIL